MRALIRQLRPAFLTVVVFTLICGVAYPLLVTGDRPGGLPRQGQRLADQARRRRRRQPADRPELHRPAVLPPPAVGRRRRLRRLGELAARTSARPTPTCSRRSASGSPPTAQENGLAADALVPVDAVTASGSGLDPHISVANARLQAPASPAERGLDVAAVSPSWSTSTPTAAPVGVLGEPGVNVSSSTSPSTT